MIVDDVGQKVGITDGLRVKAGVLCAGRRETTVGNVDNLDLNSGMDAKRSSLTSPHGEWIQLIQNTSRSSLGTLRSPEEATPPQNAA